MAALQSSQQHNLSPVFLSHAKGAVHGTFPRFLREISASADQYGNHPLTDRIRPATVKTCSYRKTGRAVRARSLRLERVKRLAALAALPKISERGGGVATGTGKAVPPR